MRLIDVTGGRITLDGIDLSSLTGAAIRERLNCLTQDPFLYPASIRANIDPLGHSSDEAIVTALQKVRLWSALQDKTPDKNGDVTTNLDTLMSQDYLSHGQRQLFCLARALLKPGKVLILDEPTSRLVAYPESSTGKTPGAYYLIVSILAQMFRCKILYDRSLRSTRSS